VLGTSTADEWVHIANGAGYVTGARVQAVMNDPGGSDQMSFVAAGVPAVQLFTGAHPDYHAAGDTIEKIDGDGLVKVAAVAHEFAAYLAERDRPLTAHLAGASASPGAAVAGERRATLGTIPDYAFAGPGIRVSGTMPGSPAASAGLMAGDVLVKIGGTSIVSMKDFADALKALAPGTKVVVAFVRGTETRTVEAVLGAR
jgi:membrane-associated protease RseP (regulator of RpoE activity)